MREGMPNPEAANEAAKMEKDKQEKSIEFKDVQGQMPELTEANIDPEKAQEMIENLTDEEVEAIGNAAEEVKDAIKEAKKGKELTLQMLLILTILAFFSGCSTAQRMEGDLMKEKKVEKKSLKDQYKDYISRDTYAQSNNEGFTELVRIIGDKNPDVSDLAAILQAQAQNPDGWEAFLSAMDSLYKKMKDGKQKDQLKLYKEAYESLKKEGKGLDKTL